MAKLPDELAKQRDELAQKFYPDASGRYLACKVGFDACFKLMQEQTEGYDKGVDALVKRIEGLKERERVMVVVLKEIAKTHRMSGSSSALREWRRCSEAAKETLEKLGVK